MKKKFGILVISLLFILIACQVNSQKRSEIFTWAKSIVDLEKILGKEITGIKYLEEIMRVRPPNQYEYQQLVDHDNALNKIYSDASRIDPPEEAKGIHQKFIDSYANAADSIMYYILLIDKNDLAYYENSVNATRDYNRTGEEAWDEFETLLNKYSISCEDLDYCK